jgi:hypothetical protein
MNTAGRSLELFFIDGRPDGLLTAEVFNWTGHVLRIPRIQLKEGLSRPEAQFTGVYVLLGEVDGNAQAYVGEAEDMRERIRNHASNKDWWDSVVLITTSADSLHKAHVKYLESRLVETARDAGVGWLENGNTPTRSSLNEASIANMESFLETLLMVLPAIRVDNFLSKKRTTVTSPEGSSVAPEAVFEMAVQRHGVYATAIVRGGEMIVQKGSRVRAEWVGDRKYNTHYFKLHDELLASGVIVPQGECAVVTEDYAFTSPSAAAAVVAGRSANGRTSWLVKGNNQTYAEWEASRLRDTLE